MIATMILTATLVLIGYLVLVYIIFGQLPPSLSATHYWFKSRGFNWPFKLLMYTLPCLLCPAWFQIADSINSYWTFLAFLSGVSLAGVGLYANYLDEQKLGHIVLTTIAATLSTLWACLVGLWIIPLLIYTFVLLLSTMLVIVNYDKNKTLTINLANDKVLLMFEVSAFFIILVTLFINI